MLRQLSIGETITSEKYETQTNEKINCRAPRLPPIGACGWFSAPVVLESHRWVTPFRASTLRGLRSVLYAGSRIECRLISIGKPGRGPIPFWACLIARVGMFSLTTPHRTFTFVDHSCVPGGVEFHSVAKSPGSVDHNLRLKADHNPRLGRWIVIQREPL